MGVKYAEKGIICQGADRNIKIVVDIQYNE